MIKTCGGRFYVRCALRQAQGTQCHGRKGDKLIDNG